MSAKESLPSPQCSTRDYGELGSNAWLELDYNRVTEPVEISGITYDPGIYVTIRVVWGKTNFLTVAYGAEMRSLLREDPGWFGEFSEPQSNRVAVVELAIEVGNTVPVFVIEQLPSSPGIFLKISRKT